MIAVLAGLAFVGVALAASESSELRVTLGCLLFVAVLWATMAWGVYGWADLG